MASIAFEGGGRLSNVAGGYDDWKRERSARIAAQAQESIATDKATSAGGARREKRKLSYKEQRELEAIPQQIQALEREQAALQARLADPQTYAVSGNDIVAMNARLETIEMELLELLERWETLEKIG